jgi:hypothetical protein
MPSVPKRIGVTFLAVLLLVAGPSHASDPASPTQAREGRGWMFGFGVGPGRVGFGGAEDLAVVVGGPTRLRTFGLFGATLDVFDVSTGEVVPRTLVPADAESILPIPSSENGMAVSLHVGWSFSRRWATLFDFDVAGGYDDSFMNYMGGFVARYSPASRIWIEAGPAFGNLGYGSGGSIVDIKGVGTGGLAAVGVELVQRPKWRLDLEVRAGTLWYREFRATNLSAQLAIGRRRS